MDKKVWLSTIFAVALDVFSLSVLLTASWPVVSAQEALPRLVQPVLVELFTSEGCSSCPPADALLAQVAKEVPNVIVLSEHVNYWNNLGWTDPFSSTESTNRQVDYAQRFHGEGPYTPQMVVNGRREFVGSDRRSLMAALSTESAAPLLPLKVQAIDSGRPRTIKIEAYMEAASSSGELVAVLVQNEGHQQVSRGENGGRTLMHVDIARSFSDLGKIEAGKTFHGQTSFELPVNAKADSFHVVVFLQKGQGGDILAVASTKPL